MMLALREVGPRDGLQNEPEVLRPRVRAEMISRLARAGLSRIEGVSFVDPRRVPQMEGAEEVVSLSDLGAGVTLSGLVLNDRGYRRLRATRCSEVNVAFCVTETFNQRNQGRSVAESIDETIGIAVAARTEGRRVVVTIGASFGCPFEGRVDPGAVVDLAARIAASGPDLLVFADTIGVATPTAVRRLVRRGVALDVPVGVHLHNTRNSGYLNAFAAIEGGATSLDASLGGIGGCPFAPNATGNIATEDLCWMLQEEGITTGVDLDELIRSAEWLEGVLGRALPGQLHRTERFPPIRVD